MTENKITEKELRSMFFRSLNFDGSFNYERQMSIGLCHSLAPVIKKLYPVKEDRVEALKRHSEFFNVTPAMAPLVLGITAAMEERNANEGGFDTNSINAVKASLMGPLSGIGDSLFWGTIRPWRAASRRPWHSPAISSRRSCSCWRLTSLIIWCAGLVSTGATRWVPTSWPRPRSPASCRKCSRARP